MALGGALCCYCREGTSSRSLVHIHRPAPAGVWGVGLLCSSCVDPGRGGVALCPLDAAQGPDSWPALL